MKYGSDFLAGVLYPKEVLKSLRQGEVGGIFLNTFKNKKGNNARSLVKRICKTNKLSELVVHLAPFDNSHNYKVTPKVVKQLMEDVKWCQMIQLQTSTRIYISFFCEHNHTAKTMRPLFNQGKDLAPNCFFINSIWKGEECDDIWTEIHIPNSRQLPRVPKNPFTVSFDGIGGDGSGDFPDCNIQDILKDYINSGRLLHIRAWNFRHNGKYGHNDPASVNNRKYFPNEQYLRGSVETLKPREGGMWGSDKLAKSFSDDHGGDLSKSKDCKLMCILPDVDAGHVTVFDSKDNKIDTLYRVKPDYAQKPKGRRYYSKLFAYQVAELAFKNTGSYLIRIANNPLIDGRLRSGLFR